MTECNYTHYVIMLRDKVYKIPERNDNIRGDNLEPFTHLWTDWVKKNGKTGKMGRIS